MILIIIKRNDLIQLLLLLLKIEVFHKPLGYFLSQYSVWHLFDLNRPTTIFFTAIPDSNLEQKDILLSITFSVGPDNHADQRDQEWAAAHYDNL